RSRRRRRGKRGISSWPPAYASVRSMPEVVISEYREDWPGRFRRLSRALRAALGEVALRIDHIGSTAVPGLAAKDIIDVQVTVADLDDPRIGPGMIGVGAVEGFKGTFDHEPPG